MYCLSIIVCFSGVERGISGGFMGAEWGGHWNFCFARSLND